MADEERKHEKIGDFLVSIGAMKAWQLQDVLLEQTLGDARMFGEIAISLGYINDAAVKRYLDSSHAKGVGAKA
jgi:hypothetical protein